MSIELLGRAGDLAAVEALLGQARRGQGGLLLISGESGIGKTALAKAAAASAATRGMEVVWGRCWEGEDAPAHWLWIQILRGLGAAGPADLGGTPGGRPSSDMATAVAAACRAAAAAAPLLILLDDLHHATPASVRVLARLAVALPTAPVALLATFRSGGARAEEVQDTLVSLAGAHPHRRLAGLAPEDVHTLLARHGVRMLGHRAARLHAATAGNPLLVGMLARSRSVPDEDPHSADPPEELRAHVRRQVDQLPGATRAVLEVVTVLARTTSLEDVATVTGEAVEALRAAIAPAVEARLVEEDGGALALRHDVVRACLYADLSLSRRVELHAAAAAALRERAGADPRLRAEVAHHVFHAATGGEDPADLMAGLLRGAADARAAGAPAEAAALLGHALACAEASGAPPATRVGILLDLGAAHERSGRPTSAERSWQTATALARLSDDRELIARAAVGATRSALLLGFATPAHVRALEEALAALGEEDSPLRAEVLALLSTALHRTHERLRGRGLAEDAVRAAEAVGDPRARATALLSLHQVTRGDEGEARRPRIAAAAARWADAAGDDDLSVLARSLLVVDHREQGDMPGAAAAVRALSAFATEHRHAVGRWAADVHGLVSALLEGDEERRVVLTAALARGSHHLRDLTRLTDFAVAMTSLAPLDDPLRARVRARARRLPNVLPWRSRALLDAAVRGEPGAEAELDGVLTALGARARTNAHWLLAATLAAEAAAVLGDARRAGELARHLEPRADHLIVASRVGACRGSVRHHLGLLALTMGDATQAVAHLREAARVHARPGLAAHRRRTADALRRAEAQARTTAPLRLVREGAYWALHGADRAVTLPDLKGIRYLARLVGAPHRDISALELYRSDAGVSASAPSAADPGMHTDEGGADPMLDPQAKRAYRQQLRLLEEERERAALLHDGARIADLDRERSAIERVLGGSVGLGGRDRRLPSELERARTSVTKALRTAVERIREADPGVAAHLDASLRTGARCSYAPPGPPQLTS